MQRIGKVERFKKELDSISKPTLYIRNSTNFDIQGLVRDFIPKTLKKQDQEQYWHSLRSCLQKQKPTIVKTVEPQQFLKAVIRGGIGELFVSLVDTR